MIWYIENENYSSKKVLSTLKKITCLGGSLINALMCLPSQTYDIRIVIFNTYK